MYQSPILHGALVSIIHIQLTDIIEGSKFKQRNTVEAINQHCCLFLFCFFAANDYGLFLSDEDPKKGIWLEAGKALDYYMLRNGVSHS